MYEPVNESDVVATCHSEGEWQHKTHLSFLCLLSHEITPSDTPRHWLPFHFCVKHSQNKHKGEVDFGPIGGGGSYVLVLTSPLMELNDKHFNALLGPSEYGSCISTANELRYRWRYYGEPTGRMSKKTTTKNYPMYLSQFANQLPGCWKLSWHRRWLCFHHNNRVTIRVQSEALWQRVYLPVLHHCSEFTRSLASGGPLLPRKQRVKEWIAELQRRTVPSPPPPWQACAVSFVTNDHVYLHFQPHDLNQLSAASVLQM